MYVMPGTVLVGFGLCALKSANHCSEAASAHSGGSPTTLGFPGIQVNPLLPSRSTVILPWASVSTIRAKLVTAGGPAESARVILACAESLATVPELCSGNCAWASPWRLVWVTRSRPAKSVSKTRLVFMELTYLLEVRIFDEEESPARQLRTGRVFVPCLFLLARRFGKVMVAG